MMLWIYEREGGSTLAAVMAVMMVVTAIAIGAIQAAMHANNVSAVDRERLQAVHGAEAGVSAAMERLESDSSCDAGVSSSIPLTDQDLTISTYQTKVEPEAGALCEDTYIRVIRAWGRSPSATGRTLRQLEVTVKLLPQQGFRFSLFASGPAGIVTVKNTGTIQGDVYAENLDQSQNNINAWDVITPGSIDTKDNAVYSGTLWAGGDVHLHQNGHVTESIMAAGASADGDIILDNNANVGRDVRAKKDITYQGNYTIGGSPIANDPNVPPPPILQKPTFVWNASNYTSPNTYDTAALLNTALNTNKNALSGVHYTGDTAGVVDLPKNVTVSGDLTIVTQGKADIGDTSFSANGGPWRVIIVALSDSTDSNSPAVDVSKAATYSPNLNVLVYTNGLVNIKNNLTMTGAIYADRIDLKNSATVNFSQDLADNDPPIPGFDFTLASASQFIVVPVLWREVVPGDPPA